MIWFRVALLGAVLAEFFWSMGLVAGILLMITRGAQILSMTNDPTLNSTLTSYVFILIFQFLMMGLCLFGLLLCFKVWRNKYMMDHTLRHLFIIWIVCWAGDLMGTLSIAVYALIRGKDPQGQMGYMYEMFQKYAIDPKFVSNFERFQKDHSCCGLYGPDDWLIVQLRASPGGAGGGGGMGMLGGGGGGMDFGYQQNPSTGRCHVLQPLIPPGCGPLIMKVVNQKLGMYAGLTIFQVAMGVAAAGLAWYCFFYWLEKEVIVIPEDEVSNIVVIEPDDSMESVDRTYTGFSGVYSSYAPSVYYDNSVHSMKLDAASTVPPSSTALKNHLTSAVINHYQHQYQNGKFQHDHFEHEHGNDPVHHANHPEDKDDVLHNHHLEHEPDTVDHKHEKEHENDKHNHNRHKDELELIHHKNHKEHEDHLANHDHHKKHEHYPANHNDHQHHPLHHNHHHENEHYPLQHNHHHENEHHPLHHNNHHENEHYPLQHNHHHENEHHPLHHNHHQGHEHYPFHHNHHHEHGHHPFHLSHHHQDHGIHHNNTMTSNMPLPSAMMTSTFRHLSPTSTYPVPLHHNSFIDTSYSVRTNHNSAGIEHEHHHKHKPKDSKAALEKQLKTLGGKVLVQMKIDPKLDDNPENAGKEATKGKKPKKATLAIVRNQHKKDGPPPPPPGKHGQTGNLAEDIAAISGGKKITDKIEDLVITEHPHKKVKKVEEPEILGSLSGMGAGSALDNLFNTGAATKAKAKELQEEPKLIKPVVVGTNVRLHGGGGSTIKEMEKAQNEHRVGHGGGTGLHGVKTMNYIPLPRHHAHEHRDNYLHGNRMTHHYTDHDYHSQPPATLDNLRVYSSINYGHHHGTDHGNHHHGTDHGHHHGTDHGHHYGTDHGHHNGTDHGHHYGADYGHHHNGIDHGNHHHGNDHGHHHGNDHGHHHGNDHGHHHENDHGHHHGTHHGPNHHGIGHGHHHHTRDSSLLGFPLGANTANFRSSIRMGRANQGSRHDIDRDFYHGHFGSGLNDMGNSARHGHTHRENVYNHAHPPRHPSRSHGLHNAHEHDQGHNQATSSHNSNGRRHKILIRPKKTGHKRLVKAIDHHKSRREIAKAEANRRSVILHPHEHHAKGSHTRTHVPQERRALTHPQDDQDDQFDSTDSLTDRHALYLTPDDDPENSNAGMTSGRWSRSYDNRSSIRQSRYLEPSSRYRDSRYLGRSRDRESFYNRSRTPRRIPEEEDDYDYEPPRSHHRRDRAGSSRSAYRSSSRRRDEDNARVLYKNPRKLDDSD